MVERAEASRRTYPQRHLKTTVRSKLGEFLLPPKHKVVKQAGYKVMKSKDGKYYFQDQFGQRPQSKEEYEREVRRAKELEVPFRRVLTKHHAERGVPPPVFDNNCIAVLP